GPELLINGDWSQGTTNWTAQSDWTLTGEGSGIDCNSTGIQGQRDIFQTSVLEMGKRYAVTVDIAEYSSGILCVWNGVREPLVAKAGITTIVIEAGIESFTLFADNDVGFVGSIRSVSVKETRAAVVNNPDSEMW
ncbi:MAG: hypothetical protein ACRBBW_21865, partial [Cellvibrionaceae bacterium]